jgi:hypothetical protein
LRPGLVSLLICPQGNAAKIDNTNAQRRKEKFAQMSSVADHAKLNFHDRQIYDRPGADALHGERR